MEINKEIAVVLRECKVDIDAGTLVLLGIYFKLDVDKVCPEEVIKAISTTKIVDKDYKTGTIQWNIPLFAGQETAFSWVTDWVEGFARINYDRKGSPRDAVTRMKDFFTKYPEYRREDVFRARDLYFSTVRDPQYLMKSHKFIFDGVGALKKSTLLEFCEKVRESGSSSTLKGKVIS